MNRFYFSARQNTVDLVDIAEESAQQKNGPAESYNPWPGYMFTGKLRPFPVVSSTEFVCFCS